MQDTETAKRIHDIVNEMLGHFGKSGPPMTQGFLGASTPFDVSKPNLHDSREEFRRELHAVEAGIQSVGAIFGSLVGGPDDPAQVELRKRLEFAIDLEMTRQAQRFGVQSPVDLTRKNVSMTGGFRSTMLVLVDFLKALEARLRELKDQEEQHWNQPNRSPDPYARAIALRLARFYARETGERPTVGTSGETGEPSTQFVRALAAIYKVLGIKRRAITQAKWAAAQITDDDLNPKEENTLGSILGLNPLPQSASPRGLMSMLTQQEDDQE